jgi:hypothetical protein
MSVSGELAGSSAITSADSHEVAKLATLTSKMRWIMGAFLVFSSLWNYAPPRPLPRPPLPQGDRAAFKLFCGGRLDKK